MNVLRILFGLLAIGAGSTTLALLCLAYARLPRVLAVPVATAVGSGATWALASGVAAFVGPGPVALVAVVQLAGAGTFVAAVVWLTLLVTYRSYLLSRSLVLLCSAPPAATALLLAVPATRWLVLEADGSRAVWGPVLWTHAIASSMVMVAVVVTLLSVAASTVPGQRPLVLRALALMAPAAVSWTFFLACGRPQALATLTAALLGLALGTWPVVTLRRPGLVQLPITVSRLLAEVEDGVVVLDESGRILVSNAAARAMLSPTMSTWTTFADARLGSVPEPGTARQVRTATGRVVELLADRLDQPGRAPTVVVAARDITELATVREHLQDVASRDAMTGVRNRRYLESRLPALVEQARGRFPLSVVMLDVDRFKHVNDAHGHAVGDRVIVGIAEEANACLPAGAELVRMGGDEFAAVLPGMDLDAARRAAARTAARCAQLQFATRAASLSVTVSVGVHQLEPWMSAEELLSAADEALYAVKHARREAVPHPSPPPPTSAPSPVVPPDPMSRRGPGRHR
ncbi:MAG: diguanylate cyclase [Micrococcales bacterium]|nr:diguanylate cyclase [Micrococcales bacterium]